MKYAHIYKRGDKILMHANSRTVAGFWIAWPPMVVAAVAVPADVGRGVQQVLASSRSDVPAPSPNEKVGQSLLVVAGVRSWRELTKASLGLMLELLGSELTIKGTSHDTKGTSLVHNKRTVVLLLDALSAEELGRRIVAAFEISS